MNILNKLTINYFTKRLTRDRATPPDAAGVVALGGGALELAAGVAEGLLSTCRKAGVGGAKRWSSSSSSSSLS